MTSKKGKTKKTAASASFRISIELDAAGDRTEATTSTLKKNYAQRFSTALATRVANSLRNDFPGILPDSDGGRQESPSRTAKGTKKLDVNYSTPELGLGLGVSIKTLNFRDGKSKRYTKNMTRIDNELRAEAVDYHQRQPYAVLIALCFLPYDSCEDGRGRTPSSFGHAVKTFFYRARRRKPEDDVSLFEKVYVGLYRYEGHLRGQVDFFDVELPPPSQGAPSTLLNWNSVIESIRDEFDRRNESKFKWADRPEEAEFLMPSDPDDLSDDESA